MTRQARGSKAKLLVDEELVFGELNGVSSRKPWQVPFKKDNFVSSTEQSTDSTLRGRRDAAEPDDDAEDAGGGFDLPVEAHALGKWFRFAFGAPTTTTPDALTLNNAAAVDLGSGKVGLPLTGHGLAVGAPVIITGTVNYDGGHTLALETSENQLVIQATYVAEPFVGDETVAVGRVLTLSASAVTDLGGGQSGLPLPGHGLPVGAEITVAGTDNYDGTYLVQRKTTASVVAIIKTYAEEELTGDETVTCLFHDHVYKVRDDMPSFCRDKQVPDISAYWLGQGAKINSLSLTLAPKGELTLTADGMGATEGKNTSAYDADASVIPVVPPFQRFKKSGISVLEGGAVLSKRVRELSISIGFGLDGDTHTLGSGLQRGGVNEGEATVTGSMTGLLKDTTFLDKAEASEETSIEARLVNGGYLLSFLMNELKFKRTSPPIEGPKGMVESMSWSAYYGDHEDDSIVVVTLRNEIKDWTV